MTTVLQETAATQTYYDVENLINSIVWKFYNKYGGSFEDWKAEANLIYTKAFNNHKERLGKFTPYLYVCLEGELLNFFRDFISLHQPSTTDKDGTDLMYFFKDKTNPFYFLIDLLDEIKNEDAKTLINLVLDMPEDLMKENLKTFGDHPSHIQRFLKGYLKKIGWTSKRITESFQEIGKVLYA